MPSEKWVYGRTFDSGGGPGDGRLLGLVSRAHILALYERAVARSPAPLS